MAGAKAKKGLGRGLSALIPDDDMEVLSRLARNTDEVASVRDNPGSKRAPATTRSTQSPEGEEENFPPTQWIDVHLIEANPYQPRRHFSLEEMEELASSIRSHGILQPVLVRPLTQKGGDDAPQRFQLVAGERRWRAAQQAGLAQVPAVVRPVDDQQALELALIENVQRHDISPLDAALAYRRLATEFGLSQEDVARRVGKSRSAIANTLRLLDLPNEIQKALEDGTLTEGHGRAILLAAGDGARRAVFRRVLRDKLSVRDAEQMARRTVDDKNGAAPATGVQGTTSTTNQNQRAAQAPATELHKIEENLQKALGTRVKVQPRAQGGRITIDYFSNEDLERLLSLLQSSGRKSAA